MKQLSQFAFAGVIGFLVDAGVLTIASPSLGPYYGRLLSFAAAVLTTWVINRSLTFRQSRGQKPVHRELALYVLTTLGGGTINLAAYSVVVYWLGRSPLILPAAVAFGSLAGMAVNFWLSKRVVFAARS